MGRIQCCSAAFESRAAWDRVLCRATLEPATDQANGVYVWAVVERVSMAILATRTLRQHAVRVDTAGPHPNMRSERVRKQIARRVIVGGQHCRPPPRPLSSQR
mmetsp:Transcript_46911/g.130316  ORF Transcript_46911/g.130316 Transcript_46911/m.130316 type:complete len:103 (-) Transcript_46911:121-429(-)|eukprot:1079481-Prymnesium_polylepis.1